MLLAGGEDSNSCTTEKSSTVGRAQQRAERKGARRPELLVGAFSGWLVRSPAKEAGGVSEAITLEMIERHFAHQLRRHSNPGGVPTLIPSTRLARRSSSAEAAFSFERSEFLQNFPSLLARKGGRVPDVMKNSAVIVEAEQQRAHRIARFGEAIASDHAIRSALVFDLHHHPLPRQIRKLGPLGDDAVQSRPSKRSNHSRASSSSEVCGANINRGPK